MATTDELIPVNTTPTGGRVDVTSSTLKFALKNPDSEAAKILGVLDHSLTDQQIDELDARVRAASGKNPDGFMTRMWDYIVTGFQSLTSTFTGNGKSGSFSEIKASRAALRDGAKVYEDLTRPNINGVAAFASLAERISGVTPDGAGGYKAVVDAQGNAKGIFRVELDKKINPQSASNSALEDRGLQPTKAQRDRSEVLYAAEVSAMYQDAELRTLALKYRPQPGGKNTEAEDFVNDPKVSKRIETIVDRIISDPTLRSSGNFNYDGPHIREQLIGRIKWRIAKEHHERSKGITSEVAPASLETSVTGTMPSPTFREPVKPETAARTAP